MHHAAAVNVSFEAGHRLPHMPGRCVNLHGHSWNARITLTNTTLTGGLAFDSSVIRGAVQDYLNTHIDHGMMLGATDPYAEQFAADNLKLYRFGKDPYTEGLDWPTIESITVMLSRMTWCAINSHGVSSQLETVQVHGSDSNTAEVRQ